MFKTGTNMENANIIMKIYGRDLNRISEISNIAGTKVESSRRCFSSFHQQVLYQPDCNGYVVLKHGK